MEMKWEMQRNSNILLFTVFQNELEYSKPNCTTYILLFGQCRDPANVVYQKKKKREIQQMLTNHLQVGVALGFRNAIK